MDSFRRLQPKPSSLTLKIKAASKEVEENDMEEEVEVGVKKNKVFAVAGSGRRGSSGGGGGSGVSPPCCQVEKCGTDLTNAKRYHRRHKVCDLHAKAPVVLVAGLRQRFCQQCSRFHELLQFDEAKRSCRRRLAGHNERRRKCSSSKAHEEGSSPQRLSPKDNQCRQVDERGIGLMAFPGNSSYEHFHIH